MVYFLSFRNSFAIERISNGKMSNNFVEREGGVHVHWNRTWFLYYPPLKLRFPTNLNMQYWFLFALNTRSKLPPFIIFINYYAQMLMNCTGFKMHLGGDSTEMIDDLEILFTSALFYSLYPRFTSNMRRKEIECVFSTCFGQKGI